MKIDRLLSPWGHQHLPIFWIPGLLKATMDDIHDPDDWLNVFPRISQFFALASPGMLSNFIPGHSTHFLLNMLIFSILKKIIHIFLFGCAKSQLQHVRSSSQTMDRTWVPCTGSMASQPLDHQGSPSWCLNLPTSLAVLSLLISLQVNHCSGILLPARILSWGQGLLVRDQKTPDLVLMLVGYVSLNNLRIPCALLSSSVK